MASRGRRRPFGDRLEIERADAGALGKLAMVEAPPTGVEDLVQKGVVEAARMVESQTSRTSARTQQWMYIGGGALATAVAWLLRIASADAQAGALSATVFACGVLGPAAIVYALAQFVWPEPPAVAATRTVGGGMLDESRQQRLWGVRIGACILGIGHLLVLFALT